jgi:putative salt-induced outer membrane protein YdiY
VVFKNGDRLTGKITAIDDGKLIIKTPAAGDVKVATSEIQTFSTDDPVVVRLADGTTMTRKIDADQNGQVAIAGGLIGNQRINVTDIGAINPPPAVWTGDIKFGGLILRGNTSSESVNFGIDIKRKTEKDVISFDASYLYGRTKDRTTGVTTSTADNWNAAAKYEYNFTPRFYGFAEAAVSRDRLAFLDLRFNPSIGVGYRWFTKPNFNFDTEGGLAWVDEHYTNGTPTRDDISLKLAYHLLYKFNDVVSLTHDLTYYPSLENISHYIVNTDLGLRAAISTHFFTEFKFVLDYDSTPANGALHTNTRYELNVGYSI